MFKKNNDKILTGGRSMIEMLGVIAIGGVLTAGTMQLYQYATRKSKSLQMESQIIDTAEDVRTLLLGRSWARLEHIAEEGAAHTYFTKKKIKLMDVWGSPIVVMRSESAESGRFLIKLSNINTGDCINMGKRIPAASLKVNGSAVTPPDIPPCTAKENEMVFYFK